MSLAEIQAMPMRRILAPRGILFLWCTWPLVARGDHVRILDAWGMDGLSGGSWTKRGKSGKVQIGTGFIWRSSCEPIIVAGIKGTRFRGPSIRNLIETFEDFSVDGLRRQHSRKPDEFYALVEKLTYSARRIDMFARETRPGFDKWGREADKFDRQKRAAA